MLHAMQCSVCSRVEGRSTHSVTHSLTHLRGVLHQELHVLQRGHVSEDGVDHDLHVRALDAVEVDAPQLEGGQNRTASEKNDMMWQSCTGDRIGIDKPRYCLLPAH
jgi:hypothetical protein